MPIIRCEEVKKTYVTGNITVEALRGITMEIDKGEMVAIMGPSGCGKTTLLNCLSGIDDVTSGKIYIEDREITSMNDNSKTNFRARRMGFIFQFYNLLPVLTATENVELPLLIAGTPQQEARSRALELLDTVGLSRRADLRPNALSGGERQRVTIARALSNTPAIVWADEPTGDLDVRTSEEVVSLMRRLNRENGQTFIIVTHDPEVGAKCDRIIHMRDGRIVTTDGNVDHIADEINQLG
ncbi:MAG: putative ABC transporter ATP-binding protein [Methanomassiliicoccales archaeon PtaU1.Bin030]|jgi:putative ABC transport system ATP-binding protein|nr:MAG: putative ABC transporter ATP-binding protein [Methanomassiliicoccales archaeon PtaU1.Bin030]